MDCTIGSMYPVTTGERGNWASLSAVLKTLYLLRHAKSSWDAPGLSDHDRPLAARGRRAARMVAQHIRKAHIAPDLVLCSSSARTRETLKLISGGFADEVAITVEPGLYAAAAEEALAILRTLGEDIGSVMLIGHNPAIQELALSLASHGEGLDQIRRKFPTAAIATLTFACGWDELAPSTAELVAFVRPRDLEPPVSADRR